MANINNNSSHDDIQQPSTSENTTKVNVFNEDFQYAMFDNADLDEMLQFAKDSRYSVFVKKHIFPVKYQDYWFSLMNVADDDLQGQVNVYTKSVYIHGHDYHLDIIKHFGESMKNLYIFHSNLLNDDRSALMHGYLNEYCCDSLIQLHLGYMHENAFTQFKKPFSKLEILHIHIQRRQIEPIRPLHELFPKLERLTLTYGNTDGDYQYNGNEFIESELPNLQHLSIDISVDNRSDVEIIQKQLENMLEKNAQIQSLSYTSKLDDFIQIINEKLPNLEHLIVYSIDSKMQSIELKNVLYFSMGLETSNRFEKLSFPRLKTLDMIYAESCETGIGRNSWMAFFKNHQHLSRLYCKTRSSVGLVELLAELPYLDEIDLTSNENFDIDIVNRLFQNHKHLMRFQYKLNASIVHDEPDLNVLREKFGNQWHISYTDGNFWRTITFKNKNETFFYF